MAWVLSLQAGKIESTVSAAPSVRKRYTMTMGDMITLMTPHPSIIADNRSADQPFNEKIDKTINIGNLTPLHDRHLLTN